MLQDYVRYYSSVIAIYKVVGLIQLLATTHCLWSGENMTYRHMLQSSKNMKKRSLRINHCELQWFSVG